MRKSITSPTALPRLAEQLAERADRAAPALRHVDRRVDLVEDAGPDDLAAGREVRPRERRDLAGADDLRRPEVGVARLRRDAGRRDRRQAALQGDAERDDLDRVA